MNKLEPPDLSPAAMQKLKDRVDKSRTHRIKALKKDMGSTLNDLEYVLMQLDFSRTMLDQNIPNLAQANLEMARERLIRVMGIDKETDT